MQQDFRIRFFLGCMALLMGFLSGAVSAADQDTQVMWVMGSYSSQSAATKVARELEELTGQQTALQETQRGSLGLFRVLMQPGSSDADQTRLTRLLRTAEFEEPWKLSVQQSTLIGQSKMGQSMRPEQNATSAEQQAPKPRASLSPAEVDKASIGESNAAPVSSDSSPVVLDRMSTDSEYHPIRLYPQN